MERLALPGDDSTSESLSDFVGYSETGSLVESVGSVEIESSAPKASPKQNAWIDRCKRRPARKIAHKKLATQYLQFVKRINDVPVAAVWGFIRDHKALASLVPGIIESFQHLEGEGGTGGVYIANYSPSWLKPGDDRYFINKVEVSDDESKLYAVRRVGGQFHTWYHVFIVYVQVLGDDVLGDTSSVIVFRLEAQLRNLDSQPTGHCPSPEGTRQSYLAVANRIKDRYLSMNRVDRPILVDQAIAVNLTKRMKLRLQTSQQLLTGAADDQEPEVSSPQRRRKSRTVKNAEGSDRESKTKQRPRRTRGRLLSG